MSDLDHRSIACKAHLSICKIGNALDKFISNIINTPSHITTQSIFLIYISIFFVPNLLFILSQLQVNLMLSAFTSLFSLFCFH